MCSQESSCFNLLCALWLACMASFCGLSARPSPATCSVCNFLREAVHLFLPPHRMYSPRDLSSIVHPYSIFYVISMHQPPPNESRCWLVRGRESRRAAL